MKISFKTRNIPNNKILSFKVERLLLDHVYLQAKAGIIASLICASVVIGSMRFSDITSNILIWYGVFIGISVFRLTTIALYRRKKDKEIILPMWQNLFIIGAVLGGLSWGLIAILIFPYSDQFHKILIILIISGVSAGATPLFSALLPAAMGFIFFMLVPFFIVFQKHILFTILLLAYLTYLIIITLHTHKLLANSINLQFENDDLLNNLSKAKLQLELTNEKLEVSATHDPLTNVANRNLFNTNFAAAIERARQNKKLVGLLFIDLDKYKKVNDLYGHFIGDQLLMVCVDRIEQVIADLNSIARLGGDEFTIIIENISSPQQIAEIAERIRQTLDQPFIINALEIKISASIGISVYPLDGVDPEQLLNVADNVMYSVKQNGGNNFRFNETLLSTK